MKRSQQRVRFVPEAPMNEVTFSRLSHGTCPKTGRSFALGRLVMTPGAMDAVCLEEYLQALARHASGDWGEVPPEDQRANDVAVRTDERLLSAYRTRAGVKFWIITEADRSSTCLLLPSEY